MCIWIVIFLQILCRVIKSEMEGHVVGGAYTHIERYPHSILLEVKCEQFYACGGSLITNDIVLTAGHCMYGCKKNHIININYGSENIDKMQQISATKYVLHHNYNRHSLNCDIALLLAMTPLPFGIAVKRVALLRAIRRYNEIEAHKTEATVCECIMFLIICALMILTESKYVPEPFVVNGNKVEYEDEFPHAVFIAVINPNGAFGCGSSMLNQKILLTAAHCIDYYDEIDYINAFAGSLRRYRGIKIRVLAFTIHEKFSSALMGNDIALALLKENLPLGDHVARVSIQRSLPNEHFGYIAGWGLTNSNSTMEPHVVSGDKVTNIQFFSHSAFISVCKGEWFVCGSSLLNQRILITAGHCITGRRKIVKIYAYTGHVRYQKGLKIPASNFIVHPKYGKNPMQHDIGLVMLQVAVPFGLNITRKEMRISTDFLYATKQKIWSLDECRHVLTRTLSEGFICGGDLNIKSFTAKGDSGSALIVDKITQVGLVSHKIPNKSKTFQVNFVKELRIVNGSTAKNIKDFPHSAFLSIESYDGYFLCGASVLNQNVLLTAAHCLSGDSPTKIYAFAGNVLYKKALKVRAKYYYFHTEYDIHPVRNDIGVVLLKKPLPLGERIRRLQEPVQTKVLHVTQQKIWNLEFCREALLRNFADGFICGGDLDSNSYTAKNNNYLKEHLNACQTFFYYSFGFYLNRLSLYTKYFIYFLLLNYITCPSYGNLSFFIENFFEKILDRIPPKYLLSFNNPKMTRENKFTKFSHLEIAMKKNLLYIFICMQHYKGKLILKKTKNQNQKRRLFLAYSTNSFTNIKRWIFVAIILNLCGTKKDLYKFFFIKCDIKISNIPDANVKQIQEDPVVKASDEEQDKILKKKIIELTTNHQYNTISPYFAVFRQVGTDGWIIKAQYTLELFNSTTK
ncbi:unnamed protein product, partial [Leptidea sinapis]